MAQRHIELLIGRLVTDEAFRAAFQEDARAALARFSEAGHDLTPVEIDALHATRADLWATVAEQLDPVDHSLQNEWGYAQSEMQRDTATVTSPDDARLTGLGREEAPGVDQIAQMLAATPRERLQLLVDMVAFEERAHRAVRLPPGR